MRRLFIALKPRKERDSATVVMARLRQKATQVPGMQAFFQSIQNLNIGGRPSKSQYQYTLQSGDTESLYRLAPEMRNKIAKVPGLLDVTTDLYIKNPQMTVDIDREKAAVYGVTVDQVRNQLTTPTARGRSAPSTCRRTITRSSWRRSHSSGSTRPIFPSSM